jgi:hypothetical protein
MRERLSVFVADVNRFGPLAVVSLATAVCVPSLLEFLAGRLAIASMLGRYCAAFVLATVGVKVVSRVLLKYAVKNATQAEFGVERQSGSVPGVHRSSDGASERRK